MSTENPGASRNQIIADIVAKKLEERLEGVREVAGKIAAASAKVAHSLAPEVLAESVTRRILGDQETDTLPFSTKAQDRLYDHVRDIEFLARSMRRELEVIGLIENRDAELTGETSEQK